MPCPSGTYLDQVGRYEESQCIACPGGKYCMGIHLTTNSGDCSAGEKELLPLRKITKLHLFVRVNVSYITNISQVSVVYFVYVF